MKWACNYVLVHQNEELGGGGGGGGGGGEHNRHVNCHLLPHLYILFYYDQEFHCLGKYVIGAHTCTMSYA